jgi:hypothetical protein
MPEPTTGAPPKQTSKPVDSFRVENVHVSIWENSGVNGLFRAASFQLRYKDSRSGEFKTSHSYGAADLANLREAAEQARTRIESWNVGRKQPQPQP